jgi:hypothetical protein
MRFKNWNRQKKNGEINPCLWLKQDMYKRMIGSALSQTDTFALATKHNNSTGRGPTRTKNSEMNGTLPLRPGALSRLLDPHLLQTEDMNNKELIVRPHHL